MRHRAPEDEIYLVWSQEMKAWCGPDARSYVSQLARAGRFHRTEAIRLCAGAVLTAGPGGLPELPVRLVDVLGTIAAYEGMTGNFTWDCWCVAASVPDTE
jgi:hypothetical protein